MNREMPLTLGALLAGLVDTPVAVANLPITGLALESDAVRPGDLFFALRGSRRHGLEFLKAVQAAGAQAVVWEPPWPAPLPTDSGLPLLVAPDLRVALGKIASRFYGQPSRQLSLVGVTGTDGKTSCVHFIAQALSAAAGPCGILGTLGIGVHGMTEPSLHTTPDPLRVQRWLAQLAVDGRRYAAMEVSSHALDQGRVSGVAFTAAVLTQLSRDHLDYHGTAEAYAAAKRRLFFEYQPDWTVLNLDDAFGRQIAAEQNGNAHMIAYGLGPRPEALQRFVWGEALALSRAGLRLRIRSSWGEGELGAGLLGRFNAHNLLAALATLLALELPLSKALALLAQTTPVVGRMERLEGGAGQPLVVIDYAHTPHALEQALRALREHGAGRLWCVFGCGGDRDPGKRPLMGGIAEAWADQVVVTDDNPRTENPQNIVTAILAGMRQPQQALVIRDRHAAIVRALTAAGSGDLVLIAGKGHEDYQIIGAQRLPFSDHAVVREHWSSHPQTETVA